MNDENRPYIEFESGEEVMVLTADSKQWITAEKRVYEEGKQAGEEYLAEHGFHADLATAVNRLVDRQMRSSGATTLEELFDTLHESRRAVENAISSL